MDLSLQLTCNDVLRNLISENLERFSARSRQGTRLRRAAVAMTVVTVDNGTIDDTTTSLPVNAGEAALVLTRRSVRLRHHAGQWALPGGRLEPGETPEKAALRELEEEVDLSFDRQRILGRLDDFATRSGFVITPIVVWGGAQVAPRPNPQEVESIHRIPVKEFLRSDAPILEPVDDSPHPILYMPVGTGWIASPTAALLYQFREVAILGKTTRVAHFEQPRFAWQ